MHIPDWNEKFLSEFDPKEYVKMLVLSQVKSAVVYAHSHVGLCYYPTKVGHMHEGLKDRNIVGEVIDLCHQNEINVVIYYSLIFDSWAYHNHPDWRIIRVDGKEAAENSRYGVCCPNSPYRDYTVAHAEEICKNFNFKGIRFDMTFWPVVCYCPHC
ncbi:alpha-L-fucosidase [Patescibacteria group bacterium]|nr:alpha-L-fucosidase [Patescibacteria group bacterium]